MTITHRHETDESDAEIAIRIRHACELVDAGEALRALDGLDEFVL